MSTQCHINYNISIVYLSSVNTICPPCKHYTVIKESLILIIVMIQFRFLQIFPMPLNFPQYSIHLCAIIDKVKILMQHILLNQKFNIIFLTCRGIELYVIHCYNVRTKSYTFTQYQNFILEIQHTITNTQASTQEHLS